MVKIPLIKGKKVPLKVAETSPLAMHKHSSVTYKLP